MAIAFDAAVGGNTGSSLTLTYAHTCTGSNLKLFVGIAKGGADDIVSVTYGVDTMTQITKHTTGGSAVQYLYYLDNPSTGSNNVVVTVSALAPIWSTAASFTGCATGAVDNNGHQQSSGTTTSLTASLTSVADNCWMLMCGGYQRAPTAGTGSTERTNSGGDNSFKLFTYTSSPKTPAGSISMTMTYSSIGDGGEAQVYATFAPAATTVVQDPIGSFGIIAFPR